MTAWLTCETVARAALGEPVKRQGARVPWLAFVVLVAFAVALSGGVGTTSLAQLALQLSEWQQSVPAMPRVLPSF